MSDRIDSWVRHPKAPLVAWITVILLFALWTAQFGYQQRRISNNQKRIIEQQQLIDEEVAARIAAVCGTALDTRTIIREVIAVIEDSAVPESSLHNPRVQKELARVVESRPVQCDPNTRVTPPIETE